MYEKFLNQVVDDIFNEAAKKYTWTQLADKANLGRATVYRLGMRYTRLPQLRTIYQLAHAVGMNVTLIKKKAKRFQKAA